MGALDSLIGRGSLWGGVTGPELSKTDQKKLEVLKATQDGLLKKRIDRRTHLIDSKVMTDKTLSKYKDDIKELTNKMNELCDLLVETEALSDEQEAKLVHEFIDSDEEYKSILKRTNIIADKIAEIEPLEHTTIPCGSTYPIQQDGIFESPKF
jgi:polyhydroxyalkanoate synthesis regulator phasin